MVSKEMLLDAGVYPVYIKTGLSAYTYSEHVKLKVKRYFSYIQSYYGLDVPRGHGLFFQGSPVKSGADLLINTIVKKAMVCGHSSRLIAFEDLVREYIDSGYSVEGINEPLFLCIAGIGLAQPNAMEKKVLTTLLWDRFYKEKPFCILSSVSLMEGEHSVLSYFGEEIAEIIDVRCLVLDCVAAHHQREQNLDTIRKKIFG